jgi:hypothetical protein
VTRALVVCCLGLIACSKHDAANVAKLEQKDGSVERMASANATWRPAKVGDGFILGSAVRTGDASHAKLRVGKSGKLDVQPNATVHFTRNPQHARDDVRVETGSVELEAGDDVVGLGDAVLDPHGKAHVESGPAGTTILVTLGRVVLEDNVIGAGESITLGQPGAAKRADAGARAVDHHDGFSVAISGKAARMKGADGEHELAIGDHTVATGTDIITTDGSIAAITSNGARGETSGASQMSVGDGTTLVKLSAGTLAIEASDADAIANVPGGRVTTAKGGAATATVDSTGATTIDAHRGETTIETAKGSEKLAAGESITITAKGDVERAAPPPKHTVAAMAAGESPVFHDAAAPTPLRITFDTCKGPGTVEVAKDKTFKRVIARSSGDGGANVLVPVGSFSYRVRCAGKGASGTIRIAKDSGRTPLPKVAAKTTVEMDGREYTILYQNLLPELTLSWRTAPKKSSYTFVLKPQSGAEKRFTSSTSKLTLKPGDVREGTYAVWVEPAGGAKSEQGRIIIDFDNAASSASIEAVVPAAPGDGQAPALHVKGSVIEGSTVSVAGVPVVIDRQRRFETDLPVDGEDGVAIRIASAKAGIHYYVMRAAPH